MHVIETYRSLKYKIFNQQSQYICNDRIVLAILVNSLQLQAVYHMNDVISSARSSYEYGNQNEICIKIFNGGGGVCMNEASHYICTN